VNRLDSFIEQLRRADIHKERIFYIHDHDNRTTAEVTVSNDFTRYEGVKSE
jgi:sugar phosphate isomerase/epimerase